MFFDQPHLLKSLNYRPIPVMFLFEPPKQTGQGGRSPMGADPFDSGNAKVPSDREFS